MSTSPEGLADALSAAGIIECSAEDLALLPPTACSAIAEALPALTERSAEHLALTLRRIVRIGEGPGGARRRKPYMAAEPGEFRARILAAPGNAATFATVLDAFAETGLRSVSRSPEERDETLVVALGRLGARPEMRGYLGGARWGTVAHDDWTHLTADDRDRVRAMLLLLIASGANTTTAGGLVVTEQLGMTARTPRTLADDALVSTIAGAIHRAPEILRVIQSRNSFAPAAIAAVLDAPSEALADGAL